MNLFRPRQVEDAEARQEVARLRGELELVQSAMRQLETEVIGMHDQVRRWMRRAVAAERAVARNQETATNGNGHEPAPETPAAPPPAALSRLTLRGARNRIAARRRLESEAAYLRQVSEGAPAVSPGAPGDEPVPPGADPEKE